MAHRSPPEGVIVRPIEPEDIDQLREGFERLSPESRHARFMHFVKRLSDEQLEYYTRVDHTDHEAVVAVVEETGQGLGVGRYIRLPGRGDEAEVAVTVADEHQGKGIGSLLMRALVDRARENGISCFLAYMLTGNRGMMHLLQGVGPTERPRHVDGTVEVRLPLPAADRHERDCAQESEWLKAAAKGTLTSTL